MKTRRGGEASPCPGAQCLRKDGVVRGNNGVTNRRTNTCAPEMLRQENQYGSGRTRLLRRPRGGAPIQVGGGRGHGCRHCCVCNAVILSMTLEVRGRHSLVTGCTPEFSEIRPRPRGLHLVKQQIRTQNFPTPQLLTVMLCVS